MDAATNAGGIEVVPSILVDSKENGIKFTLRKQRALRELSQQGYPVSDGLEYGLQAMVNPEVTLEQVWQGLSTMESSLSQEVLAEREE